MKKDEFNPKEEASVEEEPKIGDWVIVWGYSLPRKKSRIGILTGILKDVRDKYKDR